MATQRQDKIIDYVLHSLKANIDDKEAVRLILEEVFELKNAIMKIADVVSHPVQTTVIGGLSL